MPLDDVIAEIFVDGEDDDDDDAAAVVAAPEIGFRVRTTVWLWLGWRESVQGPSILQRRHTRPLVIAGHNARSLDQF